MSKTIWIYAAIIVVVLGGLVWLTRAPSQPGRLDSFASCIKETGTIFYGAFWCPNCGNQKEMFGRSAKLLPYVECSTPDGRGQLPICKDAGVEAYPTWVFPNGDVEKGTLSVERLSEATGCPLPE